MTALRAVLLLAAGLFWAAAPARAADPWTPLDPSRPGPAGRRTPIVAAIEKARPAVVSVYARIPGRGGLAPLVRPPFDDDFFQRFFGDPGRAGPTTNLGSGVIIDGRKGLVVTNEHVTGGASGITVALADGRELEAELLGADPALDLAVLEIKAPNLPQLPLGDSDSLMIGETVIAIGNPFGLTHTATVGIVSATGRAVPLGRRGEEMKDLIQTDAAINPGNSGGPLLNLDGELVGLNTAIIRGDGLGFAIPSNRVQSVAARLAQGGQNLAQGLNLAGALYGLTVSEQDGRLVLDKPPASSPAARAGLKEGDRLLGLDDRRTDRARDLAEAMLAAGSKPAVSVTIQRGRILYQTTLSRLSGRP